MDSILDFSRDLDVGLLDQVVTTFFQGRGSEQQMAQQVLTQFQEHPDAWQRVDRILELSTVPQTKFIALQILEKFVQTRWKTLPNEQRIGIRNYVVSVILKVSSDESMLHSQRTYITKLNMVLVQILKQEWPHNWPTFISEIISSSRTSLPVCENNLAILKLLSEEIFDFSAEQMTQAKSKNLKSTMCGEFSEIFQLCIEVLEKAQKPSLIQATLETLLRFLNWIPLGYIFETNIIENLRDRFLEVPQFRNVTLKCLTEIGALTVGEEYDEKFIKMFSLVMASVQSIIPMNADIAVAYENSSNEDQEFVQNLALFFASFLGAHLKLLEKKPQLHELLIVAHRYLVKISQVEEREIFKVCLEYWNGLVQQLYEELQTQDMPLLNLNPMNNSSNQSQSRRILYSEILTHLRVVMIERMVKPEEVLVVENDEGEIVREFVKESDTIMLYKSMRECLVYLTHLDVINTEVIMTNKLSRQMDGTEWSWANLNKLCWAIGSISGAMSEETEKRFLVTVIKDLLSLCEMKRGKDNKAVVASNIMYIVGQYPRFLRAHWKFLKTVVNKLFEFMHELHEGVQDMACDTFIKIAQKCKRHFVIQQPGEVQPFIDEILDDMSRITSDLSSQQVHTFYEAVGCMISAQGNKAAQERLINKCMAMPNTAWDQIMAQAAGNVDVLNNPDTVKVLGNILKTNVAACSSIGSGFYIQMGRIYMDMLGLYKAVSGIISDTIKAQGAIAARHSRVRALRTIKKEVLKLVDTYVTRAEDLEAVTNNMVPPLLEAVLGDYNRNVEQARDSEVLGLMATVVSKLGSHMTDKVPIILEAVFECTLNMINKDFAEYPEHRVAFFKLLQAINKHCFQALLRLSQPQFKLVMDSIVWAFKHTMRDIADTGLQICLELINNFTASEPAIANAFFQSYFLSILQDVFYVLSDTDHKSGFKMQTIVLARLFQLLESGAIQAPLFDPAQVPNPNITNKEFLQEYIVNLLQTAFPHLQLAQIQRFTIGLFQLNNDLNTFKLHVRDFLIQLKEFAGTDNADLFLEEREAELEEKRKLEREYALKVPGMVKPADLPMEADE
ncbi:uncharacterized protein VTP21DRAFT_8654 [Calcarisporiella thermophila]|uniref:uncharacterized protein n=1 Tax=Calcarisporiella thermophila TaxID=911321 RepID=UPI0037436B9E